MEVQTTPPAQTPPPPAPAASAPAAAAPTQAAAPTPAPAPAEVKQEAPAIVPEPQKSAAPEVKPPAPEAKAEPAKPEKVAEKPKAAEVEIKLPEGARIEPAALGKFKAIMIDESMSPSQRAQAIIDLNHAAVVEAQKADAIRFQQLQDADLETLKKDPDYGGAKYDATRTAARSILEKSKHGQAVSKKLEAYGLKNDPDITKLLAEFRSLIAEDDTGSRVPTSGSTAKPDAKPKNQTERLAGVYANASNKKK